MFKTTNIMQDNMRSQYIVYDTGIPLIVFIDVDSALDHMLNLRMLKLDYNRHMIYDNLEIRSITYIANGTCVDHIIYRYDNTLKIIIGERLQHYTNFCSNPYSRYNIQYNMQYNVQYNMSNKTVNDSNKYNNIFKADTSFYRKYNKLYDYSPPDILYNRNLEADNNYLDSGNNDQEIIKSRKNKYNKPLSQ